MGASLVRLGVFIPFGLTEASLARLLLLGEGGINLTLNPGSIIRSSFYYVWASSSSSVKG